MKCMHTGLPVAQCAHCNRGLPELPEPFSGKRHDDKIGTSTGVVGAPNRDDCKRWDSMRGRSAWAQANALRTLKDSGLL